MGPAPEQRHGMTGPGGTVIPVPCFNIALGPQAYRESAAGLDLVERLTREAPA